MFILGMDWLDFWVPTLTAFGAIATSVMVIVLVFTLRRHKQQLIVSNFRTIMEYIGNDVTRKHRQIIMRRNDLMDKVLEQYPYIQNDKELDNFNESARQVCDMYERVGFLLKQDKGLAEKIIEWQGFTTGIIWKLLKPIMDKWKEKDKALNYRSFDFVGDRSYCLWKKEINEWLENREKTQDYNDTKNS